MAYPGFFIALEGVDGCGKSTQAQMLVNALEAAGYETLHVRDPGGTRLSEKIRLLLLDPGNEEMCDECELLLYEAARAQLVREVVQPALERGNVIVCDRFFDSTYAYQAIGRGLSTELVQTANKLGSCGLVPDISLVFDLDPNDALGRATQEGIDRLEGAGVAFQQRVREGYHQLAQAEPERVHLIDAIGTPEVVHARVTAVLRKVIAL